MYAASPDATTRPPDLFVTGAALQRRQVAPDLPAESAAFCELTQVLADDPNLAVRHLLKIARDLCGAGSAGLSLLRQDPEGQAIVRWEAVSGALASYEGTHAPRVNSPCGLCLDTGTSMVVSRPERAFDWLKDTPPAIVEYLVVPLNDRVRETLGTLWIAHHDGTSRFCYDDARIAEQLAAHLVLALQLLERANERRHALAVLESLHTAQQNLLAHDLHQERSLREQVEDENSQALRLKDAVIHEVNHRTKNTLQAAASLLSLHARSTTSAPVRSALLDSHNRLQLLARAHQLLYADPDNTQSVLMPQLLHTLGDALRQTFAEQSARVSLEIRSDPITLPVGAAIPLALIANEAVTNAYKHAFPRDSLGQVTVQLQCTADNALVLRVADTGVGLHPDGAEGGMGFKLMRLFASQLNGTLEFAEQPGREGTVITLTIEGLPQNTVWRLTGSP